MQPISVDFLHFWYLSSFICKVAYFYSCSSFEAMIISFRIFFSQE